MVLSLVRFPSISFWLPLLDPIPTDAVNFKAQAGLTIEDRLRQLDKLLTACKEVSPQTVPVVVRYMLRCLDIGRPRDGKREPLPWLKLLHPALEGV